MWYVRIPIGILILALGVFMVWKTEVILGLVGPVDWAEKHFGGGGSRVFYKLFGVLVCFIAMMVITNLWEEFAKGGVNFLFGGRG